MTKENHVTKGIKGDRIGIFFGTMSPLHQGHYSEIMRAKRENDGCIVIVSGYTGDRGEKVGMPVKERSKRVAELFSADRYVAVSGINEDQIPPMPHGWAPWLALVMSEVKKLSENPDAHYVWYTGEASYQEELNKRRPQDEVILVDRQILPISGTAIRNNPLKYWADMLPPFRQYFSTNILIIGGTQEQRNHLIMDLARRFNGLISEQVMTWTPLLINKDDKPDGQVIVDQGIKQHQENQRAVKDRSNQGIVFFDRTILTAEMYAMLYESDWLHQNNHRLEPYINKLNLEKIIKLPTLQKETAQSEDLVMTELMGKYELLDKCHLLVEDTLLGQYEEACEVINDILTNKG